MTTTTPVELDMRESLDLVDRLERAAGDVFATWLRNRGVRMPDRGGKAALIWLADVPGSLCLGEPGVQCHIDDDAPHMSALVDEWVHALADAGFGSVRCDREGGVVEVRAELALSRRTITVRVWGVSDRETFERRTP